MNEGNLQILHWSFEPEWHMLLRLNLVPFWHEIDSAQFMANKLGEQCKALELNTSNAHCDSIGGLLKQHLSRIVSSSELINEYKYAKRSRRAAPLNGIGWIGHELFGLMDAGQAEKIEEHFELVEQNANHQLNLIRNQTSLVESTLNLMKASQTELKENYVKIEQAIGNIASETNYGEKKMKLSRFVRYASSINIKELTLLLFILSSLFITFN